jgi:hypothetical protein
MATLALQGAGLAIGSYFGNPQLGLALGTAAGGLLQHKGRQSAGSTEDLRPTGSQYGVMLPQVWGKYRLAGNVIWAADRVRHTRSVHQGGKGGALGGPKEEYYTRTFAVAFTGNEIGSFSKIYAEDKLIYDAAATPPTPYTIRTYLGTDDQLVDPAIEDIEGVDMWTAYRGVAYVVFEDLDLSPWGNRIPSLNAVVNSVATTAPEVLESRSSLQALYHFDGDSDDSSPFSRDLTGGTPTYPAGAYNLGMFPNQAGDRTCVTGQVAALQGTELTVSFYLRHSGGSPTSTDELMYWYPTGDEKSFQVYIDWFSQQLKFNTKCLATATTMNLVTLTRSSTWRHVVMTYKAGDVTRVYMDGELVDEQPTDPLLTSLAISSHPTNEIRITGGGISETYWDEVAIYGYAWSAAEVRQAFSPGPIALAEILADVFPQDGLDTGDFDVDDATDLVDGFAIAERTSGADATEVLRHVYATDFAEVDGKIFAVRRGGTSALTIDADDLGARAGGTGPVTSLTTRITPDLELPVALDIHYFEAARDYQRGHQRGLRTVKAFVKGAVTVDTPLVLTASEGAQRADQMLMTEWYDRTVYEFSLPWKYLKLAPGSIVMLPVNGASVRCRIVSMDIGLFAELRFSAVRDEAHVLDQPRAGGTAATTGPSLDASSPVTFRVFSSPQLRDEDGFAAGFYVGGVWAEGGSGGTIYYSPNGGTDWLVGGVVTRRAVIGDADGALANGAVAEAYDAINDVDVTLQITGALESTTEDAVDSGDNTALLGAEVIGFTDADLNSTLNYTLSNIKRGLLSTSMTGHAGGDDFIVLNQALVRVKVASSLVGATVPVKVLAPGEALGDVTAVNVVIAAPSRPVGATTVLTLRSGFTPAGTGGDAAEVTVPSDPSDGATSTTWNVRRILLRVAVAGGAPSITIEKSTVAGAFSASTIGTVTLGSGAYEASVTSALGTVATGNKLRFNVATLGTATGWTVQIELEQQT